MRKTISLHEAKVYSHLAETPETWLTHVDIAKATGVKERTVRSHTRRMATIGLLEVVPMFPKYRYRLSAKGTKDSRVYAGRLDKAKEMFGLP